MPLVVVVVVLPRPELLEALVLVLESLLERQITEWPTVAVVVAETGLPIQVVMAALV
jgi:hypothetical protein